MLDVKKIRSEFDVAVDRFAARIAGLFAESSKRQVFAQAPAVQTKQAVPRNKKPTSVRSVPKPTAAKPAEKPKPVPVRPLLNRPNVHRIPSGARLPLPSVASGATSLQAKGPAPEEIGERVERMVAAASLPPTLERIRLALKVTREALTPVVDRLVSDNRLRVVDVGGVILYKPPRFEPIRRKRSAPARRAKDSPPVDNTGATTS